ncbi:conserved hypothetical protein [Leifsonia xyli subsp. xyli str. CTCB07]|uniref:ADP-ribosylglycohydrolase n=1 Tax=Leifsonia xyli subsp. xyli (strain CTCB07) TaxID=281090 RepID=Q6ADS8_LEIXX|nr:conserved hypothetical protein [Leifsonia xyli subsp. xyli str. CTCB07]
MDALPTPPGLAEILAAAPGPVAMTDPRSADLPDRVLGAWLGRAAGCLLGKPVEKISLAGIRALGRSTGNWPLAGYFTERGLDPEVAARYPWNRRSRPTSLVENIDGMPEDDDLNFPLIALGLLEALGRDIGTDDVATSWLNNLPGGRVFTAERITYRNLLDGWANPGDPVAAASLAWRDARLSHGRNGLYGALFAAAACAAAVTASSVGDVIAAGLSVVPAGSRYAAAIRRGAELGAGDLGDEAAVDALHAEFGHLHWVHSLNNSALLAFALTRGDGDFARTITLAVSGGWDTDSVGATAGSISGALTGAAGLPAAWIDPLDDRLASSIPGLTVPASASWPRARWP